MKRIWAILLSIAIMMNLTVAAFAAEIAANTTNMDMTVVQDGKKITIELTNSQKVEFDTMTFNIKYDSTQLEFQSATYAYNGDALTNPEHSGFPYFGHSTADDIDKLAKTAPDDNLTVGFYYCDVEEGSTNKNTAEAGELVATVTFKVDESVEANDEYTVTLSEDSDGTTAARGSKSQTLTFKSASAVLVGDVDGNGKVNNKDLTALARYLAKWTGYESINMTNADTTGEGKINNKDLTTLARYLAKWSGYETLPVA